MERADLEKILLQLEEKEYIDPGYSFEKNEGRLRLLGSGGSSFVYEMFSWFRPQRRYAVKVVEAYSTSSAEAIIRAVRLQYSLSEQSDNIVRIITVWSFILTLDEDGLVTKVRNYYDTDDKADDEIILQMIVMEKLESVITGDKFGHVQLIVDNLKTEDGIVKFAKHIGSALKVVHDNYMMHRDIKLENIFWDKEKNIYKLGDFGFAKYVEDGLAETIGYTEGYGAPEIINRIRESYSVAADIYSFGISLYLLLNNLKFPGSDSYKANRVQYSKEFAMPAPYMASEKMARIIGRMCSYYPQDRYTSVEEIENDINAEEDDDSIYEFEESGDYETVLIDNYESKQAQEIFNMEADFENEFDESRVSYAETDKPFLIRKSVVALVWLTILGIFLYASFSGKIDILGFLHQFDLGWIVQIALFTIIHAYMLFLLILFDNEDMDRVFSVWIFVSKIIKYGFVLAGVILLVMGNAFSIEIPDIINRIHFLRTGIGMAMMDWVVCVCYFGLDYFKDEESE